MAEQKRVEQENVERQRVEQEKNGQEESRHKNELINVAEDILRISKTHGCEAQDTMIQTDSKDISVRNGEVEQLLNSVADSTPDRLVRQAGAKELLSGAELHTPRLSKLIPYSYRSWWSGRATEAVRLVGDEFRFPVTRGCVQTTCCP